MKKTLFFFIMAVLVFMGLSSCSKSDTPTTPAAATNTATSTFTDTITDTPSETATGSPVATWTFTDTYTDTATPTDTVTGTATDTVTDTPTDTNTDTPTNTPNATQTVIAQQTAVAGLSYKELVSVPGGTYIQTRYESESFTHTISAFQIGKYEVTYDLWYMVKTWALSNGYTFANAGMEGDGSGVYGAAPTTAKYEPVTTINWRDVIVWCNAYSEMTGLAPVYYTDVAYTTPIKISTNSSTVNTAAGSEDSPYVNLSANGYRLPTEGEWQSAASYIDGSSWTPCNYASGATADSADATATGLVAWYSANSGYIMHDVSGKTANALDIYDMSGNVWEWCWDWYGAYPGTSTDYRGPANGSYRVLRGGSYSYGATSLQVGFRNSSYSYNDFADFGFRLAKTN